MKFSALLVLMVGVAPGFVAAAPKAKTDDTEKRNLFQDDEDFWSRFVQEVTSSIITPSPTPFPSEVPSSAPTGICFANVGTITS